MQRRGLQILELFVFCRIHHGMGTVAKPFVLAFEKYAVWNSKIQRLVIGESEGHLVEPTVSIWASNI
jgi:hypothetical protein